MFKTLLRKIRPPRAPRLDRAIPEISPAQTALLERFSPYTMTSIERQWAVISAISYLNANVIRGDIVECGVWRGGNMLIAKELCKGTKLGRKFYLYDTFTGMSAPGAADVTLSGEPAEKTFRERQRSDHTDWVYASLDDVRDNFRKAGLLDEQVFFIKGKVEDTLRVEADLPKQIALLRKRAADKVPRARPWSNHRNRCRGGPAEGSRAGLSALLEARHGRCGSGKPGVGAMPEILRRVARFLHDKIGWQGLGFAICLGIIVFAFVVLYFQLRDIVFGEVLDALRTIGRPDVPYRIAALAGFTSYAIGHNVGFSAFSGGAVRYRIYSSAAGLSLVEVAKICFIAGLTFWLGNVAVLGLGFATDPTAASAIDRLPPALNRAVGVAALVVLVAYVIWVSAKPRHMGRESWNVQLPGGGLTVLQTAIGVVDLSCAAAAMYVLMPAQPPIDFITLAVIFVSATLLGFASSSPGGLGVFDAAMLVALTHFDKENLLGALLLFRLFYYIVPFALALVLVGVRELLIDLEWISEHMPPHPEAIEEAGAAARDQESSATAAAKAKRRDAEP